MTDPDETTHLREHFSELRKAFRGIGRDVGKDVVDAPRLARQATKNALATAAGVRKKPIAEWSAPEQPDPARKTP
jgi:hypothetical protein